MNAESESVRVVAALLGDSVELREVADEVVEDGRGSQWFVRPIALTGLLEPGGPVVFAVSEASMDSATPATWVAANAGDDFEPLNSADAVAAFLAAVPAFPAETIASVIAATLGPEGAERVLVGAEEVENLFEELAPRIPAGLRTIDFEQEADGWRLGFLSARLARTDDEPEFRVNARRWAVELRARKLQIATEELVAGEVLARYRGR